MGDTKLSAAELAEITRAAREAAEKLEADAFIIDLEQQAAWRKDGDARVATLRAQTEKDNLGKELLTDRYRVEFWESMATKVRARVRVSPIP